MQSRSWFTDGVAFAISPGSAAIAVLLAVVTACASTPEAADPPQPSTRTAGSSPTPRPVTSPSPTPLAERPRPPSAAEKRRLDTSLIAAAWRNDLGAVRRLLAQGADLDRRDETRQNTFLIAASEGYDDLLALAVERGADVTLRDSFDGTALIRAAERGHWRIVGRLLQPDLRRRSNPDHVNNLGWTALHEAVILGRGVGDDLTTVRVLVAGGVDVGIGDSATGRTPREHAGALGQEQVARTLARAEGTLATAHGRALLRAAGDGDADGVAVALRAGASLEARDRQGRTALALATLRGHAEVARVLLALGA